jgi:hypothetical protein
MSNRSIAFYVARSRLSKISSELGAAKRNTNVSDGAD